jgi:flagellar biosynthesis protein FlhA
MTNRLAASFAVRTFYNPTVMVALALMAVIIMMILPVPAWLVDIGLTLSFALAILTFMVTLFIERPLDFSAFPTVLLGSLLLRLSLNVSSTKLIIGQGHTGTDAAGGVIEGFANFVMGGSLLLGIVVFGVLLIVNFIVITKGAGRMAEVGARFALDGMPGKQLAIDSDMSAGAIDHKEASERRRREQEETTFFGSLDGAAKFVKGDAIAGLLIIFLNLIVGMTMGAVHFDMPMADAFETYAILTVGDGLVSQIPSVIISVAAALLIAKGGVLGSTDKALITQLGGHPGALGVVAILLILFAFVPGLPFIPFMAGGTGLAACAWWSHQAARQREAEAQRRNATTDMPPDAATLGDQMDVDEIRMEFSKGLVASVMDSETGICARIGTMRKNIAVDMGFIIPDVRLTDNPFLDGFHYLIKIQGAKVAEGDVMLGHVLLIRRDDAEIPIPGVDVAEPVYGAPARWVAEAAQDEARILDLPVATPNEVIATHLMETIKAHMRELVNRQALQRILDEFANVSNARKADANRRLLAEMVPDPVPRDLLQAVMRLLLEEQVSVRNLPLILEAVAEAKAATSSVEGIAEAVRRKLSLQITNRLVAPDGTLPLVQLGPEWEGLFRQHEVRDGSSAATDVALPPSEIRRLAAGVGTKVREASARGQYPAIAVPGNRRRLVRLLLEAGGINNPVLAFEEIGTRHRPAFVGVA